MKTDIVELKRALVRDVQKVCEYLLPNGVKVGSEWVHDPGQGKLKVELRGSKAGVWSHFGGDGSGDLIDLWMQERGQTLREALADIRDYLGIKSPVEPRAPREYSKPIPVATVPVRRADSEAARWLSDVRLIPAPPLDLYGIGVLPDGETVAFPFYGDGPAPDLIKTRHIAGKAKPTEAGCRPILFGWHTLEANGGDATRRICIVEGELDAPSGWWLLRGSPHEMPVLSVPFGGGGGDKQQWVENDWERLLAVEEVWLALDNDAEGDAACEAIAERVGRYKCRRVRLPRKDFNECLVEVTGEDGTSMLEAVNRAFDEAEEMQPEALKRAEQFIHEVQNLFHPEPGTHVGYTTPFRRLGSKLMFRPSEVTVWSGDSGSGKSMLLNMHLPHWVQSGSRIAVASLEMPAVRTLMRAVKQAGGIETPSKQYVERCLKWFSGDNPAGGELLLYDFTGKVSAADLLDVFLYARMRYGCDQFVIDSLMRLGIQSDDYVSQEGAVYGMVDWAMTHGVHLHLVAHNRKPREEGASQGQSGVKGAMEVVANAANQIEVVRRRRVEAVREKHERGFELTPKEEKMLNSAGVLMSCNKQRHGDWEGTQTLWFDEQTYRYRDVQEERGAKVVYCE